MEDIFTIQALSPLDGRYQEKVNALNKYCSEFGLIKVRTQVEIEWLIALAEDPQIDCINNFNQDTQDKLRKIYLKFSAEDALRVKKIEVTTNHDVKAVEYFINEQLEKSGIGNLSTMVHFACTSEDINNLSYALILKYSGYFYIKIAF